MTTDNKNDDVDDLINAYHVALKETVNYVQTNVLGVLTNQLNLSPIEDSIIGIFLRIHLLTKSLVKLNHPGDFNTAALVARVSFELSLDIRHLMSKEVKDLDVEKFITFKEINNFRKAVKISEFQDNKLNNITNSFFPTEIREQFLKDKDIEDIEQKVINLWGSNKQGKPKWPDNWTGKNIRERAKSFGSEWNATKLSPFRMKFRVKL